MASNKDWYPNEEAKTILFAENYVKNIDAATLKAGLPANTFAASKQAAQNYLDNHQLLADAEKTLAGLRTTVEGNAATMSHDIRAVAKQLKNSIGTPPEVLEMLELLGSGEDATQRVAAEAPQLRLAETVEGVEIKYTKYGHQGIELFSCRTGETTFASLGRFTQNRVMDARPLLAPGRPETRQYYAVYLDKDQPVGKRSATASLPVGGPLPGAGPDVTG